MWIRDVILSWGGHPWPRVTFKKPLLPFECVWGSGAARRFTPTGDFGLTSRHPTAMWTRGSNPESKATPLAAQAATNPFADEPFSVNRNTVVEQVLAGGWPTRQSSLQDVPLDASRAAEPAGSLTLSTPPRAFATPSTTFARTSPAASEPPGSPWPPSRQPEQPPPPERDRSTTGSAAGSSSSGARQSKPSPGVFEISGPAAGRRKGDGRAKEEKKDGGGFGCLWNQNVTAIALPGAGGSTAHSSN